MPIREKRRYVERCKQYLFIVVFMLFSSSCGIYRINKTSDFGKIGNLSELNGTYQNKIWKAKLGWESMSLIRHFASFEEIMAYNNDNIANTIDIDVDWISATINKTDTVNIRFLDNNTLLVSCLVNDSVFCKEFKGEKKKKYFEIYRSNKQFIIPLIYSNIKVGRLRIGRYKKTNDLLIRHLNENFGNLLIIMGGEGGERPFVYKRIE